MIAGILAASMTACSNNSSEMDSLKRENKELKAQIAELEKKDAARETSDSPIPTLRANKKSKTSIWFE